MNDPFGTAAVRDQVLAGWSTSPVRFREDANHEEDFALGGYRDRLVVELAQNAADAASRAGVRGTLRLTLRDELGSAVLVAANTGAPLTAEGVASLATLRASAKRTEPAVGRFGVGFAAVLAVTDEPIVLSRTGGVRFSRDDTADLVADLPALAEELRRRSGHVPVLRLPYEADGEPPNGFDTAVVLTLRDEAAADLVRRLLAGIDDTLLLALPSLARIEVDVDGVERVHADADQRWHVHRTEGTWTPDEREHLLADRPTEERSRPTWSVLWAVPRDGQRTPGVVHAPTPTDEPLSLPAVLLASVPLDPTRRHVAEGPLTDRLVQLAADAYAELVRDRAEAGADVTGLVPVGLPAGRLDGALRTAILDRLPDTPMLRSLEDPAILLRPRAAVVLDEPAAGLVDVLASVVDGLVAPGPGSVYDVLGVRRIAFADLIEELAAVGAAHPPEWWRGCYAALGADLLHDPVTRDALGGLPVPLVDGRVVRGARGLLLPVGEDVPTEALELLAPYGLRVVHPDAVHDTLQRLGAVVATPRALLDDRAVRAAVNDSVDADEPEQLAGAVLALVAAAVDAGELPPGALPWLGGLALADTDGVLAPADSLLLPESPAETLLDPEDFPAVDGGLVDRFGGAALEAAGVVRTLGLVVAADVELDVLPDELIDLDQLPAWADQIGAGPGAIAGEVRVVRDLEFVRTDAWPRAIRLLAGEPELRRALVEPVRVMAADGTATDLPSYTEWWLRRELWPDGRPADPDAGPEVAALFEPAPDWTAELDPDIRRRIGLVRTLADLDPNGVEALLTRLGTPEVAVDPATLLALWGRLGELDIDPERLRPPARIRVLDDDGGTRVVDRKEAVVADAPMWWQRTDLGGFVPGDDAVADLLDLPLATEAADGQLDDEGVPTGVPEAVRSVMPEVPDRWWEHERLLVDGYELDWWVDDAGRAHAATVDGLAKALCWSAGQWSRRHVVAAVLAEPDRLPELLADLAYD